MCTSVCLCPPAVFQVRATLDVVVGSDGRRGLHYILLARALILGGSHARAAAADQVPTATGKNIQNHVSLVLVLMRYEVRGFHENGHGLRSRFLKPNGPCDSSTSD
jgi:hypothetical protein